MRSRRPSPEHTDAVARRLAELSAQLDAAREPLAPQPAPEVAHEVVHGVAPAVGDEWWAEHTRVVARPPLRIVPPPSFAPPPPQAPPPAISPVPVAPSPTTLPVPGRHAARREVSWAPDLVPAPLRGRVRLGAPQVTAVAVLVAVALAITSWWVVRSDPAAPVPVTVDRAARSEPGLAIDPSEAAEPGAATTPATPAAPEAAGTPASPGDAAPSGGEVVVDVAGRVRRPGIVVLDAGSRVVDALEQAGGARPGVDLTSLNLARVLVDGEQLVVGAPTGGTSAAPSTAVPPSGSTTPTAPGAPSALVDLNLADQVLLETLPNVGPVTAAAILAWREEHGAFTAVTELLEVDGIGETTLAQLTPYVTV